MRGFLVTNKDIQIGDTAFGIPWVNDADGFNFISPNKSYNINSDPLFYKKIENKNEIRCIVIGGDLVDYSFLTEFGNMEQLYLYTAENLSELSFIDNFVKLRYLHIGNSKIKDISPIAKLAQKQIERIAAGKDENGCCFVFQKLKCLSITDALIEDISPLKGMEIILTDLNLSGNRIKDIGALRDTYISNLLLADNPVVEKMTKSEIKDLVKCHRVYV